MLVATGQRAPHSVPVHQLLNEGDDDQRLLALQRLVEGNGVLELHQRGVVGPESTLSLDLEHVCVKCEAKRTVESDISDDEEVGAGEA